MRTLHQLLLLHLLVLLLLRLRLALRRLCRRGDRVGPGGEGWWRFRCEVVGLCLRRGI